MLKTEQNTPEMQQRILKAAKKQFKYTPVYAEISAHFEHGQWWITFEDDYEDEMRIYSVQDAEGTEENGVFDGFCFEEC